MRKRLALAAALIHRPRVLILDEPPERAGPARARDMRDTVAALAAEGRTVFLATHLLDVAEKLCHRVAIIGVGTAAGAGHAARAARAAGGGAGHLPGGAVPAGDRAVSPSAAGGLPVLALCRLLIGLRLRLLRNRLRRGPQVGTARFAALLQLAGAGRVRRACSSAPFR